MLLLRDDMPSLMSLAREAITVPGYACRTFPNGDAPICHRIDEKPYTWGDQEKTVLGIAFAPFADKGFELPKTVWSFKAINAMRDEFYALTSSGQAPVIFFSGDILTAVEKREST